LSFGYYVKIHIYLKNFSSRLLMDIHPPFLPRSSVHKASALLATAVAAALLSWPVDADALSLGRSRGAAVLGRTLDVSVLASVEPKEETPESGCFSAEVFYGETRIGAQNVTLTPVRSSSTEVAVRVRVNTLVDEAFVTVYLRALCGASVSRRYVLLADAPSESAAAVQAPFSVSNLPATPATSGAGSATVGAAAGSFSADVAAKRKARDERRAALRASQAASPAANATPEDAANAQASRAARDQVKAQARELALQRAQERKSKSAAAPAAAQMSKTLTPRLKVDLLDLAPLYEPQLRSSSEMLSQPTTDLQARAQAAAMWRAINSSPEDLLRDGDRLKAIETDVRAMSELTKQQSKELASLRSDLSQAQRERYANPLVYALGALSLGALAFAVWAWRRRPGRSAPWWGSASRQQESDFTRTGARPAPSEAMAHAAQAAHASYSADDLDYLPPPAPAPAFAPSLAPATFVAPPAPFVSSRKAAASVKADFANSSSAHSTAELVAPVPRAGVSMDFGHSAPSTPRSVNAEELFDIQQQADFFMSLGQHSQAIDILQNHISDNVGTSALAYLDLFDIYHKIGQRDDFDALREEFNRVFNAQVPEFDSYGKDSRGLEDYESAMQRIQALWPSTKVLAVIEESIFRMPELDAKPFDLEAYRELMLLYALAKDLSTHDSVIGDLMVDFDLPPGVVEDFSGLNNLPVAQASAPTPSSFSPTKVQPLSAAQDVDIDLDIWGGGADVAKTSLKTAAHPQASGAPANTNANMINFEVIQRTDFSRSKNAKL
jgi:hypothetical protein